LIEIHSTIRGAWKMMKVGVHLARGAATLAFVYPVVDHARRLSLKQRWSRKLIAVLGIECRVKERSSRETTLIVANHSSWVDIFVINALVPAAFVCKEDVRSWPLIGWFSACTDSIYLRRGNRRAAHDVAGEVQSALLGGLTVAAFPEGTTYEGSGVLPFHGALFQGAVDAGCAVQPMALNYTDGDGVSTTRVAYCGDMSFIASLWQICCSKDLRANLHVLPPIPAEGRRRQELAKEARGRIAASLASARSHDPSKAAPLDSEGELPAVTISA
jgi:1-acyl-sn-glycerol-3-phosphate acyltransferase